MTDDKKEDAAKPPSPLDDKTTEWVKHYMAMWELGYSMLPQGMKNEEAKAGAINGMMVGATKGGLLGSGPEAPQGSAKESRPQKPPRQTPLTIDEVPKGKDGKPLPAYDRNKPGWNYCPNCGSQEITHDKNKPKTGKYQACWDCRLWLRPDKDAPAPMDDGGERK